MEQVEQTAPDAAGTASVAEVLGPLLPFFPSAGAFIRESCDRLDEQTGRLLQDLIEVNDLGKDSSRALRNVIQDADGPGVSGLIDQCREMVSTLHESANTLARAASESFEHLELAVAGIATSYDYVDRVEEVAKEASLLALNGRIEAHRAGSAGLGFAVVADGLKELGARAKETVEGLRTAFQEHRRTTTRACSTIEYHVIADAEAREETDGRVTELLGALQESGSALESAAVTASSTTEIMSQLVAKAITSNQGVDRDRQRIHAACNILDLILASLLEHVGPAAVGEALTKCAIDPAMLEALNFELAKSEALVDPGEEDSEPELF